MAHFKRGRAKKQRAGCDCGAKVYKRHGYHGKKNARPVSERRRAARGL